MSGKETPRSCSGPLACSPASTTARYSVVASSFHATWINMALMSLLAVTTWCTTLSAPGARSARRRAN
ncbi:hypothetical protein DUNSADRAFT_5754 [Dunaliella salina]|uniref:Uncharacterized protein n=1 Tax=Dunaliella salina TaxID=3046 RepID=A0ABQ7H752_DUNSA|nr:hypothetical protein DUNSADRAFT_5754 [Dunaliella salina]|eukprot:KAF5842678.1 hypothetical protein DUNSADRAFT_5754 [Dunaliella salina]